MAAEETNIPVIREGTEQEVSITREPIQINQGGGAVNSVNGQTGDVVLDAADVGALPDSTVIPTVNDATLTIQKNGSIVATFSANSDSDQIADITVPTAVADLSDANDYAKAADLEAETAAREGADTGLQSQIDAISASSDVTDLVGTYADLQSYDTSTLGNNDIIKVLQDESRNDETTYYRWSTSTQTFTLIGEEGPYYTKSAADAKFQDKLTPGANITIDANNEISATDTTYSDFTGTDGSVAGTSGLVPAPATTDTDKFLKSDGTWDTAGGGTLYSTTGTNADGAMTQLATSNMIYPSGSETSKNNIFIKGVGEGGNGYVCIGQSTTNGIVNTTYGSLALGTYAQATGTRAIAISGGNGSTKASGVDSIAIGRNANALGSNSIAIGNSAGNASSVTNVVAIGYGAYTVANSIAIGYSPSTNNNQYGIAIGYNPRAWSENSIAIGHNIRINNLPGTVVIGNSNTANTDYATRANEFCVHASTTANQPMFHSNVATPTLGTDAANKDYVDAIYPIGAVFTSTSATAPTIAGGTWTEIGTQTVGSATVHYYERTA